MAHCSECGQTCAITDAWTIRGLCGPCRDRKRQAVERVLREPPMRLFAPAPEQLPGQLDLVPDECRFGMCAPNCEHEDASA